MKLKFIFLGKKSSSAYDLIMRDYLKRINSYVSSEFIIISDKKEQKIEQKIEQILKPRDCFVTLDEQGKSFTTMEFADFIDTKKNIFNSFVLLIGGSYGIPKSVIKKSHIVISLSKMTLPHMMARLMIVEQTYRTFTILNNHPYHHE